MQPSLFGQALLGRIGMACTHSALRMETRMSIRRKFGPGNLLLGLVALGVTACSGGVPASNMPPTIAPTLVQVTSAAVAPPTPVTAARPAPTMMQTATALSPTAIPEPSVPKPLFMSANGETPLDLADRMVQHVSSSNTSYQHKDTLVTWAGLGGATQYVSYADCSGFVNALLAQAYGLTPDDFKKWLGTSRPLAKDYFAAVTARRGFTALSNIAQLQPGDLITIRYLNSAPGDNTGHLLLVVAAPQPHAASKPFLNGTTQWDVTIVDSSESGHGKDDTRRLADGSFHDGVGRGVMRLYANNAGAVVAYTWSDFADSELYDRTARPLAIGRLDPQFVLR